MERSRNLRKLILMILLFAAFALPVWANNPPRPDGVLYLVLVFPVTLVAGYLAGVPAPQRQLWARIMRGLFFAFVILVSAAGTEMGLLAMLIVVVHGLSRAVEIVRHGDRTSRWVLGALVAAASLAAGVGYVWALAAGAADMVERAKQMRTMAGIVWVQGQFWQCPGSP